VIVFFFLPYSCGDLWQKKVEVENEVVVGVEVVVEEVDQWEIYFTRF